MRKVLILYSYFSPAFKAGGPIQSIRNLVLTLNKEIHFDIFTSAFDLGDHAILDGITPNEWNNFADHVRVYYASRSHLQALKNVMRKEYDYIYVNGMFSPVYNILPLVLAKRRGLKILLAPRGMLQRGALSIKPLKKKLFLRLFKIFQLHKKIAWHATDEQEKVDIRELFGSYSSVTVVNNIPKRVMPQVDPKIKNAGDLQLVYLSLITEKKNLAFALRLLRTITTPIVFHIFGPVKDQRYWQQCQELMKNQIHEIKYCGLLDPSQVQETLSKYHGMILPTKGENFGHAIYESFSVGRPVIISANTPWGFVQEAAAGISIADMDELRWKQAIETFISMDQEAYQRVMTGAYQLAVTFYDEKKIKFEYLTLFK